MDQDAPHDEDDCARDLRLPLMGSRRPSQITVETWRLGNPAKAPGGLGSQLEERLAGYPA